MPVGRLATLLRTASTSRRPRNGVRLRHRCAAGTGVEPAVAGGREADARAGRCRHQVPGPVRPRRRRRHHREHCFRSAPRLVGGQQSRRLDVRFRGQVTGLPGGCQLAVRTQLSPRGALRVFSPVLRRLMRRSWEKDLAAITRQRKTAAKGTSVALLGPLFRLLGRTGLLRWFVNHQRLVHTFATNLRGPAQPLTFAGARCARSSPSPTLPATSQSPSPRCPTPAPCGSPSCPIRRRYQTWKR